MQPLGEAPREINTGPTPPAQAWWCEAYGPPPDGVDPTAWPLCFVNTDGRRCSAPSVCAHTMSAERRRIYGRIQEDAAAGDDVAAYLAEHFPTPGTLLGGGDDPGGAR